MKHIPAHLDAADSDLLRDTIAHHDELIACMMRTAASPSQSLTPAQLENLYDRFILVLEVACELWSRPADAG